jgi:hypothetical protein
MPPEIGGGLLDVSLGKLCFRERIAKPMLTRIYEYVLVNTATLLIRDKID